MEEQGNNQNQNPPEPTEPTVSATNAPEPAQAQGPQWHYQSGHLAQTGGFTEPAQPVQPSPSAQTTGSTPNSDPGAPSISWNASEFVSHEKTGGWYVYVVVAAIVLAVAIYFITKDIFSVAVIVVVAIAFAVFGALKPRVLEYSIGPDGIQAGPKHFNYEEFRSFAVIEEGALPGIQLLPHKRFAVPITMYFDPAQGDKIVNIIGEYLPFEHRERDLVDRITSKIHF